MSYKLIQISDREYVGSLLIILGLQVTEGKQVSTDSSILFTSSMVGFRPLSKYDRFVMKVLINKI